ncbi:MAG: DNA translocase FtsK 4TM domain-containing protein [Rubricella sp.]
MTFFSIGRNDPLSERRERSLPAGLLLRAGGIWLLVLAVAAALALATHNPADPSRFIASDTAPTNLLGAPGAGLSALLLHVFGHAAWLLVVVPLAWGVRLVTLRGARRVFGLAALPFAIPLAALALALHIPPAGAVRGLGGVVGDELVATLLPHVPTTNTALWINGGTALASVLAIVSASIAGGMGRAEAGTLLRGFGRGIAFSLRLAVAVLRRLALLLWLALASLLRFAVSRQRAREAEDDAPRYTRAEPGFVEEEDIVEEDPEDDGRSRLMARLTASLARRTESEALEDPLTEPERPARRAEPQAAPVVQHPQPKRAAKSRRALAEEQPSLAFDAGEGGYDAPSLALLEAPVRIARPHASDDALAQNAKLLESVLDEYGIGGEITAVKPGPVVTMYELEPAPGLKASRVIGLADDIARSMSALAARVSTVPGRSIIGIELPNDIREKVLLREILSARAYGDSAHKLPLALGKDIGGEPVVANLARMPHLLIAGTTGSGKSVAINTMILSLLYKLSPEECRMIMIDPKMLELSVYDGIPHLLSPVVTDPKKAVVALKWVVAEMEERYRRMSRMGVRNIDGFNARVQDALDKGEAFTRTVQTGFDEETGEPVFETEEFEPEKMPYIVVIVDEMADLMMVAGKEIEACIQRLAQMARASGIHLIMATQRPSVDVITGTIKANFPTRISFQVTSKIDSRTILGEQGAEQLLGQGDMLHMAGGGRITRVHGPFVSDEEVEDVVNHLKSLGAPEYVSGVTDGPDDDAAADLDLVLGLGGNTGGDDALYDQAVAIVARDRKCSTSYIQRKLAIGYNKAARLVEQMEENGVVSPANKVGKRDILVPEVN